MNLQLVKFIKSAATPGDFIRDSRSKIIFAGKSNVGKSSVINCLLRRKNFARVGSEPGKTIHVNYFLIDEKAYFVDLPGYGFANVPKSERDRWSKLMEEYFRVEDHFDLGVMIVDARHKPTADDVTMADWFKTTEAPFIVLANKIDKVKKSELASNLSLIRTTLELPEDVTILPFSAETWAGRDELLSKILQTVEH